MILRYFFFLLLCSSFLLAGSSADIIPKPQKLLSLKGHFTLTSGTKYQTNTRLANRAIAYLQMHLKKRSGYTLKSSSGSISQTIMFSYTPKKVRKAEGYRLEVRPDKIRIEAKDKAGFFYAVVSLMQVMDVGIWQEGRDVKKQKAWRIGACKIEDYPRFKWRGLMLDVSRNFFSVQYVKKFIDRMAQHKLNRFHWHLSDDEGWRIEIKRYPLLTKIGAKRGPGTKLPFSFYPAMRGAKNKKQTGYYRQNEIKEIVAYAKARCVEILPEIDLPAHAKAALVSYPDLLIDPKDKSKYRSVQKVANNTLNPGLESSYAFVDNVLKEVSALFPFGYVHMGGDEVPKGAWKHSPAVHALKKKYGFKRNKAVERYFFRRVEKLVAKHHKRMIVWEEAGKGRHGLSKKTLFMAWKSPKSGKKLLEKGSSVIMAPVQYLYFDQQYVRSKKELGHTWSTPVSTQKVYAFNPPQGRRMFGVHACLWSETLLSEKIADYLAWPRTLALSELAWTAQGKRKWSDFRQGLKSKGLERLKVQGIHYRP